MLGWLLLIGGLAAFGVVVVLWLWGCDHEWFIERTPGGAVRRCARCARTKHLNSTW